MYRKLAAKSPARLTSALCLMILASAAALTGPTSPYFPSASAQGSAKASRPALVPNHKKYRVTGLQPATGRSGSASLTARALLGKDGKTLLEATTGELDSAAAPPGNINKIQLKPLDQEGEAMYARNFTGLNAGGYFKTSVDDLGRGRQVQVQANVGGIDPQRTDVVTVVETVKLRPDLAANNLVAPATAAPNSPVNITAVVRELNAEAGATADCALYVDGVKVDQILGLWVNTGGAVSAAFTHTFTSAGAKQVEVRVENVVPGDYDTGNNSVTGSVEVAQPGGRMNYEAWVWDLDFYSKGKSSGESYEYGALRRQYGGTSEERGWQQGAYMQGYTPRAVTFPLGASVTETDDGAVVTNVNYGEAPYSTNSWDDGQYRWENKCTYNFDPASYVTFYLCAQSQTEVATGSVVWGFTNFTVMRDAGDVVYYSAGYDRQWWPDGSVEYSYSHNNTNVNVWGAGRQPFGAERGISLTVTSADGKVYTASPVMTLQPYNNTFSRPNTCHSWDFGWWSGTECSEQDFSFVGKVGYAADWSNP
jgi:hypothetical protein